LETKISSCKLSQNFLQISNNMRFIITFVLQLREIRHENLNAFIGGCLLEESLLLIWDYCSRGSLRDVLDNGDLKLDDMFVSSLVGDLLRVSLPW